jgi:uncharacterized repeat protein (TIGR01451 family)
MLTRGATVAITGAFSNQGTLGIEILGPSPGLTSQVQIGGAATFSGTLAITTTGFTPVMNQSYQFAIDASTSGKFKKITGQSIPSSNLAYLVTLVGTSATLTVKNSSDTSLTGTFPAAIGLNTAYSYVETIHNNGPMPATNIVFVDTLPAGVAFVSASSTSGTCTHSTTPPITVTCKPAGSLAVGGIVTITINVRSPGVAGTITNKATVKSAEADVSAKNNALTQKTTVS